MEPLSKSFNMQLDLARGAYMPPVAWLRSECERVFEAAHDDPDTALGALVVLTALLIEKVESADPAHGLKAVQT